MRALLFTNNLSVPGLINLLIYNIGNLWEHDLTVKFMPLSV